MKSLSNHGCIFFLSRILAIVRSFSFLQKMRWWWEVHWVDEWTQAATEIIIIHSSPWQLTSLDSLSLVYLSVGSIVLCWRYVEKLQNSDLYLNFSSFTCSSSSSSPVATNFGEMCRMMVWHCLTDSLSYMLANPAAVIVNELTTKAEHTKGAFLPTHVYSNLHLIASHHESKFY